MSLMKILFMIDISLTLGIIIGLAVYINKTGESLQEIILKIYKWISKK